MESHAKSPCTVCGRPPIRGYRLSMHAEVTCLEHPVRAWCVFCTRPHEQAAPAGWKPFSDRLWRCPSCLTGAVETQHDARRHLPRVRRQLAAIGLELPQRVLVKVVRWDEAVAKTQPPTSGVLLGLTEQVLSETEGSRVTGIDVVAGLPPTYFGRVVAHELGHAWLALHGSPPVAGNVAEGLCELFAYAWLKRVRTPMAESLRERMRVNPNPVYGDGFREVYTAVRQHGIAVVLERLLRTGELP
jgi:hypothetical protein